MAYGRIQKMFKHRMYPGAAAPCLFVANCDWYELVRVDDVTGLPVIRYNENFEACKLVDLETCVRSNCVFWPHDPLNADSDLYTVIANKHGNFD